MTVLSLPTSLGAICFILMDSNTPIPQIGEALGFQIKNSVGLNLSGDLWFNTPTSRSGPPSQSHLKEGDYVRMEVDLDSTPRTVQLFVNGEAVMCSLSLEKEHPSELTPFHASPNQHQYRHKWGEFNGKRAAPKYSVRSTTCESACDILCRPIEGVRRGEQDGKMIFLTEKGVHLSAKTMQSSRTGNDPQCVESSRLRTKESTDRC
ncbi:hypothetical protein BLNAU_7751 [Blattamonas nauphoetae]|uniref:Uncharacterized protein n=1 Tax=Blattamonas nauphoetae TaxID=2049346 RepID=A0ABQ9Y0V7_9EUKA|nr:hypothetical protein BLNAU_7751 [Blattamonas nauphoetae]